MLAEILAILVKLLLKAKYNSLFKKRGGGLKGGSCQKLSTFCFQKAAFLVSTDKNRVYDPYLLEKTDLKNAQNF